MYSSDFGIVSDGQLHNMQRDLVRRNEEEAAAEACERMPVYREKESGILGSLLSNLKTDDLIIIAIGILLLLDGKKDNDLLAIALIVLFLL